MPLLDNPRHEAFARNVVAGATYAEAARQAGFSRKTGRTIGSQLAHRPEVAARIKELQAEAAEATVQQVAVTREFILSEMVWNAQASRAANDRTNHNRVMEALARTQGMFKDNLSVDDPNSTAATLRSMTAADLQKLMSFAEQELTRQRILEDAGVSALLN